MAIRLYSTCIVLSKICHKFFLGLLTYSIKVGQSNKVKPGENTIFYIVSGQNWYRLCRDFPFAFSQFSKIVRKRSMCENPKDSQNDVLAPVSS